MEGGGAGTRSTVTPNRGGTWGGGGGGAPPPFGSKWHPSTPRGRCDGRPTASRPRSMSWGQEGQGRVRENLTLSFTLGALGARSVDAHRVSGRAAALAGVAGQYRCCLYFFFFGFVFFSFGLFFFVGTARAPASMSCSQPPIQGPAQCWLTAPQVSGGPAQSRRRWRGWRLLRSPGPRGESSGLAPSLV